ncbi:MAG: gliding motility-associated C-terminal domain-containing protein [Paludibacteraceae bacterium]|nr:gliding motility-associated C-terminal domain-containing protein [Paludibacteraceae bacterium]
MADPASYDNIYEYVQFMTSERIDFSETPYTVIICNNGTILHPSGWLTGSTLTYAIQLDSGVVEMGETFYIGGPTPKLNGPNSEDIHLKNWFAIDCTAQDGAGGIGLKQQWRIGMVGNGGPSADGIAVFAGKAEDLTEESVPLDCVFYGDAVGDAAAYQYRLTDSTLLDEEDDIYPSPGKECLMKFEGVYNYLEDKWVVERISFSVPSFTEEDFKPAIKLIPYVFDVEVSSTPCEECITWKSILPDTTRFAVLWQEDSTAGCPAYPTTICSMPDSLPEGLSLLEFSTEKNLCTANAPMAQHLVAIYPMENGCIDTLGCDLGLHIAQATLRETTTSHLRGCLGDTTLYLAEGRDSVWVELPTPQFDNPCNQFHLTSTFQPDSFAPGTYTFDFALRNESEQVVDQCATLVHVIDTIPPIGPDTTPTIVDTIPTVLPDTTPTIVDTIPTVLQDTTPTIVDTIPTVLQDTTPTIVDTIPTVLQDTTPTIVDTIPTVLQDTTPTIVDTIPTVLQDTTPAIVDTIPTVLPDTTPAIVDTIPTVLQDTAPTIVDTIPTVLQDTTPTIVDTIPTVLQDTTPTIVDTIPTVLQDTTPTIVDTIPTVLQDTTPTIVDTIPSVVPDTTPTIVDTIPSVVPDTTPTIVDTIPTVLPDTTPTIVDTIPTVLPDTTPTIVDTIPEREEDEPLLPTDTISGEKGSGKAKDVPYNLLLTPNGDGINDRLEIESLSQYPDNEIYIYNKWGIQVFHMKHYDNHWGGDNHNGFSLGGRKLLPVGTYYYLLLSKGSKALSGFIELSY